MQSIKDKLHDMTAMREAKAEAKQQEQAEKELAKARKDVAHEVRLAKEAEAAMDIHVNRAAELARQHESKHPELQSNQSNAQDETITEDLQHESKLPELNTNQSNAQDETITEDMSNSKR